MKALKRIEITAILLLVAIIIFASFFGVYKKEDFRAVDIIKNYNFGMKFTKNRLLKMVVNTSEEEVIYDSEGNVVENDGETEYTEENGYKIEHIKINPEEALTKDNYELTKKILKNRLKKMGAGEYEVTLNKETGEITVRMQENDDVEELMEHASQKGEFTIIDKDTQEVLLDNSDVKSAKVVYGASSSNSTSVYLQLNFNTKGKQKLEEISQIYVAGKETVENEEGEMEEKDTTKYVSVVLDGQTYSSTYFGEKMSTGILYVPIIDVSDAESLRQYVIEFNKIATIINSGELPIEYQTSEETVDPILTKNKIAIGIAIPSVILLVACIVLVVKFNVKGFIATYLQIGYIALLLLILRYTNVVITIEGAVGILVSIVLNYAFVYMLLKNLKEKQFIEWDKIGKFALITIPVYVIAIILAFNSLTRVNSFGMTVVWGSICLYIYHLTITRATLKMLSK